MLLKLDHTQRLNLHALLGAQRADVAGVRAIWAIQDKLALNADEEKAISLKREVVAGQERALWDPTIQLPPIEISFADSEIARVRAALETWDAYGAAIDRRWLEPLIDALTPNVSLRQA